MIKKLLAVFLLVIAACVALVACAEGSNEPKPPANENGAEEPAKPSESDPPLTDDREEITKMYLTINGNKLEVTLAQNSSVDALVELLQQGDITYTADDYGGFEKVGNIGHTLPRNDTRISVQSGDVILYQGNNLCLYYGTNSWSFTRIGKINGYSVAELRTLLCAGSGSIQVTISLK